MKQYGKSHLKKIIFVNGLDALISVKIEIIELILGETY